MRYLISILRIFVLVAVVLATNNFSDIQKVKAAPRECTGTAAPFNCVISSSRNITSPSDFENMNLTITNPGTIVTFSGTLTFNNLTVTKGAQITQEAIATGDVNDDGTLNAAGQNKKVDLIVKDTLTLSNQGRIDVSAKGFPGGTKDHPKGYGPGGGTDGNTLSTLSGGAHGGRSCSYRGYNLNGGTCMDGGNSYGDISAPFENGSGGGFNTSLRRNGAAGGGIIKLTIGKMFYFENSSQTFISANGDAINSGTTENPVYNSAGGAGGSIWIKAPIVKTSFGEAGSPSADGYNQGRTSNAAWGMVGTVSPNNLTFGKFIVSNGGALGGAGGLIKIDIPVVEQNPCFITGGDTIPAVCEGKDVTVVGTTINMNKVRVIQSDIMAERTDCGDSFGNTMCNSKRYFKNLTLDEGAILTHEAVTIAEMAENVTNQSDGSLADETKGRARWKKVEIEVIGELGLKEGSRIDVIGKGYSGGVDGSNGYGPGGGSGAREDYSGGEPAGAGGGYGGKGGTGIGRHLTAQSGVHNPKSYDAASPFLEFGSGGGSGLNVDADDYHTTTVGGAGGGRIHLAANRIEVYFPGQIDIITANGAKAFCDNNTKSRRVCSGGGAGGTVWIQTGEFASAVPGLGKTIPPEFGAGSTDWRTVPSDYGYVTQDLFNQRIGDKGYYNNDGTITGYLKLISAKGGDTTMKDPTGDPRDEKHAGGTGGGGRIILAGYTGGGGATKTIQSKKIEVIVTWKEGTSDKTVKLFNVLRSVVN